MGLDLYLLPFEADYSGLSFSHSILGLDRSRDLFDLLLAKEKEWGQIVPQDFKSYMSRDEEFHETHYGKTFQTPYGIPLKWMPNFIINEFSCEPEVVSSFRNKAVFAYLKCLPPKTKIALYWA